MIEKIGELTNYEILRLSVTLMLYNRGGYVNEFTSEKASRRFNEDR